MMEPKNILVSYYYCLNKDNMVYVSLISGLIFSILLFPLLSDFALHISKIYSRILIVHLETSLNTKLLLCLTLMIQWTYKSLETPIWLMMHLSNTSSEKGV